MIGDSEYGALVNAARVREIKKLERELAVAHDALIAAQEAINALTWTHQSKEYARRALDKIKEVLS